MTKHHIRLEGKFDQAPGATVTIDRGAETFSVRPLRRKRAYTLPLRDIAQMVLYRITVAELREKKRAKKAKRGKL